MDNFNPEIQLVHLKASFGVPLLMAMDFEEWRKERGLTGGASAFLDGAIQCILVGWREPIEELLRRATIWATAAIREREVQRHFDPYYSESTRFHTIGMARWLLENIHDEASFRSAVMQRDAYYQQSGALGKEEAKLALIKYVNAGAYESALSLHMKGGLKPPTAAKSAKDEGATAYLLAQHRLRGQFGDDEIAAALKRLFKTNIQGRWLGRGHYERAAEWMKVAYWKPGGSALATVLRCYDFMPDLAAFRPAGV